MDKDIIIDTVIGEKMVNPEIVKIIKDAGFCIVSDKFMRHLLDDELELIKFKESIYKNKRRKK